MATHTEHRKPTFDDVWLMFQETDKKFQETSKQLLETKEQLKASEKLLTEKFQETDKKFQETDKILKFHSLETEQRIKDLTNNLDRVERVNAKRTKELDELFTGQWGKLVETLVEGKLVPLLNERGIDVLDTSMRLESKEMEIDIVAANGKDVVLVEVKTTLKVKDVDYFIKKLNKAKKVFPRFEKNNIIGAVAYLKADEGSKDYAIGKGLFVIKATGSSASIVNSNKSKPKIW